MRFLEYLKRFTYTPNDFYDHLMGMEDAASGDVDLVILPAMLETKRRWNLRLQKQTPTLWCP